MVIVLSWIPCHCDITGNETADDVALNDSLITQTTEKEISLRLVKTTDRKELHNDERLAIRGKVNQSHYRPEVPEESRKLKFPDYVTVSHNGGKVVSLTHRPV